MFLRNLLRKLRKRRLVVPNFEPREDLEPVVQEIANLHSRLIAQTLDGTKEQREKTRSERDALIAPLALELEEYLEPYTKVIEARKQEGHNDVPWSQDRNEWYRCFAEYAVRLYLGKV